MFEAHCRALEISEEPNKRTCRDILLVTTSDDAFATILADLNENNAISYEAVKRRLTEKYSGEEYKLHLENKQLSVIIMVILTRNGKIVWRHGRS